MVVLLVAAAGHGRPRPRQFWPGDFARFGRVPNLDWRLHLARKLELAISIGRNFVYIIIIIIRQVRGLLYGITCSN